MFPFLALAIVKDALPKKVLFDLIYRARLMPAAKRVAMRIVSEAVPRVNVLDRAVEIAEQAAAHRPEIVALGRDLYYRLRGARPRKRSRTHGKRCSPHSRLSIEAERGAHAQRKYGKVTTRRRGLH